MRNQADESIRGMERQEQQHNAYKVDVDTRHAETAAARERGTADRSGRLDPAAKGRR
jgi:hypothetical protein